MREPEGELDVVARVEALLRDRLMQALEKQGVGKDALKRQEPATFVPTFFTVNFTAGVMPRGMVVAVTNESVVDAVR